jgi:hypothetical protein
MSDLKPGDFCSFQFFHWPRGVEIFMDFHGTIIKVYPSFVLIEDMDGRPFLVHRAELKFRYTKKTH